ncbi:MAG: Rieske (2Fe-2S) protein [Parasphingorhabdus sp.]|uniref:Rieske (2Fe-2S) protein n=1 Tax=Parasphingorhabdus sp. TaxID=2709688 RepID=UPI0030038FD2
MAEHKIGSVAAVRAGEPTKAKVDKTAIALFACGDDIVATSGRCPHAHGPLHEGEVDGTLLTCPWHGWEFDLKTGICEEDPELELQRFPVRIDGDDIWVTI